MQDGLESRVDRLERENRWLKRGGFLALAAVAGVVLMGQAPGPKVSDEVRTKKLVVVDGAGTPVALLFSTGIGSALVLYDKAGKARVGLAAAENEPKLDLFDESGKIRVALVLDKGGPALRFADEAEQTRVGIGMTTVGPVLGLFDTAGKTRVGMSMTGDGPSMFLSDETGKPQASMEIVTAVGPRLYLEDTRGYAAALGATELVTPKTGARTKRSAASLVMFDKEKNVLWEAP